MNNEIQSHGLHTTPCFYQQVILTHYSTADAPAIVSCHAFQFLPLKIISNSCILSSFKKYPFSCQYHVYCLKMPILLLFQSHYSIHK